MKLLITIALVVLAIGQASCLKMMARSEAPPDQLDPKPQVPAPIVMEAMRIGVRLDPELGLTDYDATTLFNEGLRYHEAEEYERALVFYRRILKEFPSSRLVKVTVYNAGRCLELSGQIDAAIAQYRQITQQPPDPSQAEHIHWVDAMFRLAVCLIQTGRDTPAIGELSRLIEQGSLVVADLIEAIVLLAEAHVRTGELLLAEQGFRRATGLFRKHQQEEYLDPSPAARAEFRLAELAHSRFIAAPLRLPEQQMRDDLEAKARLLLAAQNGFLRCMRFGDPHWATAAGFRIGKLYIALHQAMETTPTPEDFDAKEIRVYRELLRKRTAVLLHKALKVFEMTVQLAERTGSDNAWTSETRAEMARVEKEVVHLIETEEENHPDIEPNSQ